MRLIKKQLEKIPDSPGIYLFYNKKNELVYVGKATSLKHRVRSYFFGIQKSSRPIEKMIHEVVDIKWKGTDSVLEAIILEANFIKKYLPKYNVEGRDNKSWNYIIISKDEYPLVDTMRGHELDRLRATKKQEIEKWEHIFGPYPGLNTRATMKLLRKIFHFSTCQKRKQKKDKGKPCLYYQMGTCLGVCVGEISSKEYKKNVIRPLRTFLRGGKKRLIQQLETSMKKAAQEHAFEEAARLRNQIEALRRIQDVALLNESFFSSKQKQLKAASGFIHRIEGYDISNLGKSGKVGSMVVFMNGEPDKSQYRKFKIRGVQGQSDVDCLAEVVERRLKHADSLGKKDHWPLPNVFLIDGGTPQVNRVKSILKKQRIDIPVVGIAKGPQRKKNEFILGSKKRDFIFWVACHKKVLIQARDEAHRFAIAYQRKLREKRQ